MIISLVLLSGMLLAGGLSCLVIAFARFTPRLEAAVEWIGADGAAPQPASGDVGPVSVNPNGSAPCCTALRRSRYPMLNVGRYGCRTNPSRSSMPTKP
jgi:hypothetical protein